MNIRLELVNPRRTASVEQIMKRNGYHMELTSYCPSPSSTKEFWVWELFSNGKGIGLSLPYSNKAQCRNVGKKFADICGIEWRE